MSRDHKTLTLQEKALSLMTLHSGPRPSLEPAEAARQVLETCNVCGGFGWVRYDLPPTDPRFGKLQRCPCKALEDAERLQRLSGLTPAERALRLSDIVTQGRPGTALMISAVGRFLDHPYGFLTIHGSSGNAKTAAMQATVNHLIEVGIQAVYVTAFDLISYIQQAYDETTKDIKSQSAYERLLTFASVPFLAVDELDKVKWTEWVEMQVTDLIDRRYRLGEDRQAGTMISMNKDPRETLPMWIYSRLTIGEIIENNDPDIRAHLKDV